MQTGDVEPATTFLAASAAYYSATELASALGWTVLRAQAVLNTLERRWIVHRRRAFVFGDRRPRYAFIPQKMGPPA